MATQDKVAKVDPPALVTAREHYNLAVRVHNLERRAGMGTAELNKSIASVAALRGVLAEQDPEVKKGMEAEKKAADEAAAAAKKVADDASKTAAKGPAPIPVHETPLRDK